MPHTRFKRTLSNGLVVASTEAHHAEQLEELQNIVFPTLDDSQRFKRQHYLKHIDLFPHGQFVVLDGDRVVGMTTAIRLDFHFEDTTHTFDDIIQGGWMTSHDPEGPWLYGADIGSHPEYRRKGIARALYAARHDTVRRLGLKGQVTAGMMSGYGAVKDRMSGPEYYEKLKRGEVSDPTVSAQMRIGFEPCGLLSDYLLDPLCDNYSVCLVLDAGKDVPFE